MGRHQNDHPALKGIRPVVTGGIINFLFVLIKGVVGIVGNSYAMVADAIESATDIFGSLILWLGLRTAAKAPDKEHPYGHGKAEPLAGLIVSLMLAGAAIMIVTQSISNIEKGHKMPKTYTLWVLAGVILVKEGMFQYSSRVGKKIKSKAVEADAWHHRSDALSSVAALIGVSIAVIGGPGYQNADDWAAMVAAGVIFFNAYRLFRPALDEMMDAAPSTDFIDEIRNLAEEVKGVAGIEKCFVRKMGFEYYVDIHVEVPGDLTVSEGHSIAHNVKAKLVEAVPAIYDVLVHIEPVEN